MSSASSSPSPIYSSPSSSDTESQTTASTTILTLSPTQWSLPFAPKYLYLTVGEEPVILGRPKAQIRSQSQQDPYSSDYWDLGFDWFESDNFHTICTPDPNPYASNMFDFTFISKNKLEPELEVPSPNNGLFSTNLASPNSLAFQDSGRIRMDARSGNGAPIVIFIQDLGSSNGTYINGVQLQSHQAKWLNSGDILRLGISLRLEEVNMELTPVIAIVGCP
ncbi:hypothetical protein BDP27DRAFT_1360290 [Rhodocollybia butyracea]|uniref:FHA domain-containing protein n=1 Tax=Rhodocollybia butyracea TaxID=206335 RepID=A0A9P5UCN3_9AGAR|nr:hypothetical protein BDP27DRAFT_1360290 [Rhodocollybia butyracea]